ncbi:MAG: DNA-directed RNA polymerase subunit omega [Mogibacterium sp.]|nr:DNA-directed RNA polymerase subunit omega [Mogibacterium sp.]
MLYPSINELKEKTDSRYTLCILAAKRSRDIIAGKPVLTDVDAERPVSLAANEIAEDLITYKRPAEVAMTVESAGAADEAVEAEAEEQPAEKAAEAADEPEESVTAEA